MLFHKKVNSLNYVVVYFLCPCLKITNATSSISNNNDFYAIKTKSAEISNSISKNQVFALDTQIGIDNSLENNRFIQNNANTSCKEKIQEKKGPFKFFIDNAGTPVEFLVLLEEKNQTQNWVKIINTKDKTKPYEIVINTNYSFFERYKKSEIAMESLSGFATSIFLAEERLMKTYSSTKEDITAIRIVLNEILKNWKSGNE